MEFRVPDLDAWKLAKKDEWLQARFLLPAGYFRKEYRAKRLVKLGLAQSRKNGYVEEFYVPRDFLG